MTDPGPKQPIEARRSARYGARVEETIFAELKRSFGSCIGDIASRIAW